MVTPLSEKQIEKIITLSKETKLSRPDIASKIPCSKTAVYRYQKKNGLI